MTPTTEQLAIIRHDLTKHATVLAVAGSGKTQTMVYRIRHLIQSGVPHNLIRAVMYNRSAREDFERKLLRENIPGIKVSTFHSLGYNILLWASKNGHIPVNILEENALPLVKDAIRDLRSRGNIGKDQVIDADEALAAISTWKAMLTPPEQAGHLIQPIFIKIYERFEQLRHERNRITFDDQIYDAVRLLESNKVVHERMANQLDHLIIDEFQDVNLARLRLTQILAGRTAKVMVVGDDDQCIYEWQGARSSFIKRGFAIAFTHFPHATYKLTQSFRFGPAIAQIASNVIGHNSDRVEKDLVAHNLFETSDVELHDKPGAGGERQIPSILHRLTQGAIPPKDVVILVRKYAQSFTTQLLMVQNQIPFFVDGQEAFHKGFAVQLALNYIEVAANLDSTLTPRVARQLVEIVNRPNRFTKKDSFAALVQDALRGRATIQAVLADGYGLREAGVISKAAGLLNDLALTLRRSTSEGQRNAGDVLDSLLTQIDFKAAFSSFQNDARADDEVMKMQMLGMLLDSANIAPRAARSYLESMDTTRGRPREECIQITSIFRAKGLEWDYAILPGLLEGHCPDTRETVNVCVNVSDPNRTLSPTETLESERRLFYVAVTRARKGLYLFADASDSRPESRFIPEAVVEPTLHAVGSLQRLGRGADNPNLCVKGLVESAGKDARLREGVLKMLRHMAADASAGEVKKVLGNATYLVNSRESAPFTYPRAYPEMSRGGASVSQQGGPLGLPF